MSDKDKLTTKERLFIEYYLGECFYNGTQAARRAGYAGDDNTLAVTALQNLRKPKIQSAVSARVSEAAMPANEVLARLSKQARGSLTQVLDEDGKLNLEYAKEQGTDDLVKRLKMRTTTRRTKDGEEIEDVTHEYEIHDSQTALVHLGRFYKLFVDKTEMEHSGNLQIEYVNNWRGAKHDDVPQD